MLGTIPYIRDLNIPEEDMAGFPWNQNASSGPDDPETLDIAVVMLRHVSNFTDFAPLTWRTGRASASRPAVRRNGASRMSSCCPAPRV